MCEDEREERWREMNENNEEGGEKRRGRGRGSQTEVYLLFL